MTRFTHGLRVIWALLIKNNAQGGFLASVGLLAITVAFALFDSVHPMPGFAWVVLLYVLVTMSIGGGMAAFNYDFKNDAMKFLDYLPVRRWQIWLAGWLDGLFWLWALTLSGLALRAYRGVASPIGPGGYDPEAPLRYYFDGRGTLLGAMGLMFCGFAVSAYARASTERDNRALIRAITGASLTIFLILLGPMALGVAPTLGELAAPLFAVGIVFSVVGMILFIMRTREWGPIRRFAIALPVLVLIDGGIVAILIVQSQRWQRYEPHPSDGLIARMPGRADGRNRVEARDVDEHTILCTIYSMRSGEHVYRIDAKTGQRDYLGRRGRGPLLPVPPDDVEMLFNARYGTCKPPDERRFITDGWRAIVPATLAGTPSRIAPFAKDTWASAIRTRTTSDERLLLYSVPSRNDSTAHIYILDADGQLQRRIRTASDCSEILLSDDDRLLVREPSESENARPPRDMPPASGRTLTYTLIDLRSGGSERSLQIRGAPVAVDRNLTSMLVCESDDGEEKAHRTLVRVSLHDGSRRVLLDSDRLPPEIGTFGYDRTYITPIAVLDTVTAVSLDGMYLVFDQTLRYAVSQGASLQLIDTQTGKAQPIVSPEDVKRASRGSAQRRDRAVPRMQGFSKTSDAILYEFNGEIRRRALADGSESVFATAPAGSEYSSWEFSPDRRSVLCRVTVPDPDGERARARSVVHVWRDGVHVTELALSDENIDWLNDAQLLLTTRTSVIRMNADGRDRTELFALPTAGR